MDTSSFDRMTKDLATSSTRRHALAGLSAVALVGVGMLGQSRMAATVSAEDARRRCIERCNDRGGNNQRRQRHKTCRRRCKNR
jgi:hypothetical protein